MAKSPTVKNGSDDPLVSDTLRLIATSFTDKNAQDTLNQSINDMFKDGATIKEPYGPRKIGAKKLLQAVMRMMNDIKPLDFRILGSGAQDWEENLVTECMASILHTSGYASSFRDKGGVANNMLMYGDGFRMFNVNEKGFPFEWTSIANSNFYTDSAATSLRRGNKPSNKCAIVFSAPWSRFQSWFPDWKEKGVGPGKIPRDITGANKETNQSYRQQINQGDAPADQVIEWCYGIDLDKPSFVMFAGAGCSIMKKKEGKDYPYWYKTNNKMVNPFMPVSQYMCVPSAEGFYNYGLGAMFYDLVRLYQGLFNQLGQGVEDNVYPLELVSIPQGQAAAFYEKVQMAHQQRARGRRGFIPIEYSATSSNAVTNQQLVAPPLADLAELMFNRIDLELKRFGIYLDEQDQPSGSEMTATQVLANIENQNKFLRQTMEYNSSEAEEEVLITMAAIKQFVSVNDKTPLNVTTPVYNPFSGKSIRPDFATLGFAKQALNDRHYFVRMNDRTGYIPSQSSKRASYMQMIPFLQPGSPASDMVIRGLATLDNMDLPIGQQQNISQAPDQGVNLTMQPSENPALSAKDTQYQSPQDISQGVVPFRELSPAAM